MNSSVSAPLAPKLDCWSNALTVHERICLARLIPQGCGFDRELAATRMQKWRSQSPFQNDKNFTARFERSGITEDEFQKVLGIDPSELRNNAPTSHNWVEELENLYTQQDATETPQETDEQILRTGFLYAAEPLIRAVLRQFRKGVSDIRQKYSTIPFVPEDIELKLLPFLGRSLFRLLLRTMVLELNVARVQELLSGETGEERFLSYLKHLRTPGALLALVREYPLLARSLWGCAQQWRSFGLELIEHLCADCGELSVRLGHDFCSDRVAELNLGAGDTHRQGRSVAILKFASGARLVYKPRSLEVEVHFNELLQWCNGKEFSTAFRINTVFARGAYGWVEYVDDCQCSSNDEVQRFYYRMGASLALLYALNAADFHQENVLAAGEHPVLIDLEALFHPLAGQSTNSPALDFMSSLSQKTVLRVCLLPQRLWVGDGNGVDISAMGGSAGQMSPDEVLTTENEGTDEMRFVRKRLKLGGARNRPRLDGQEINPADYSSSIAAGFDEMYRLILKNRAELLSERGPLRKFLKDEVRMVARPTKIYGQVMTESYHPNLLRDALDRDRLLDRLWVVLDNHPKLAALIAHEQDDLRVGDVPVFSTRPGARHVWTSRGKIIEDYLDECPYEAVTKSIERLSLEDLHRQQSIIQYCLASLLDPAAKVSRKEIAEPARFGEVTRVQLIDAAREIGNQLLESAFTDGRYIGWMSLQPANEAWTVAPSDAQLYCGNTGIALFLAYLAAFTNDSRFRTAAEMALITGLDRFEESCKRTPNRPLNTSAFLGDGSLIYCAMHLGHLWREDEYYERAIRLAKSVAIAIDSNQESDLLAGNSGFLCVLCSLFEVTDSEIVRDLAKECADSLVARAKEMPKGIAWKSTRSKIPLTGFSHGASGIAHALLQFASIQKDKSSLATVQGAIEYERSHEIPGKGNWRDLRDSISTPDGCLTTWCHGAAGIGLARAAALPWINDAQMQRDIALATESTIHHGLIDDDCLCHGNFGNLEALLVIAGRLNDQTLRELVYRRAGARLHRAREQGWACSTPGGVSTHGLMLGLAGIGYSLLRLVSPEHVPSILLLEPPRAHSSVMV